MTPILLGVVPVFALIALGWILKASGFLPAERWAPIERLTYFALYPGFLVPTIWSADFTGLSAGVLALTTIGSVGLVGLAAVLLRPLLGLPGPAFTSVFQGVVRWNAFVFLPVVAAAFGPEGLALAAVVIGALVPFINVICVLAMLRWGEGQGGRGWRVLGRSMATNPIILSCVAGVALNLLQVPRLPLLAGPLELLGAAALPMGLIVAGSGLSFRYAATQPVTIGAVCLVKLVVMPLMMWGGARLLGGDALTQGVALLCGSAPGAAAAYVLARQMGGDAPLMAGIVAFTTVGAALTIPLLLALFHFVAGGPIAGL